MSCQTSHGRHVISLTSAFLETADQTSPRDYRPIVIGSQSVGAPLLLLVVCDKTLLKLLVLSVVNGDLKQADFIHNSVMEEEEERCHPPLTEPPQVRKIYCSDKRCTLNIKRLVHPKMKISLCFTHPRGILGVYGVFFQTN